MRVRRDGTRRLALVLVLVLVLATGLGRPAAALQEPRPMLGLLEFPQDPSGPPGPRPFRAEIRIRPSDDAAVAATFDERGVRAGADYHCRWYAPPYCHFRESGYELPGLTVFDVADGGWFLVGFGAVSEVPAGVGSVPPRLGWVHRDVFTYRSLEELLAGPTELTLLLAEWDGKVYEHPGGASRSFARAPGDATQSYRALETRWHERRLWLRVELIESPCLTMVAPRVLATGWVPATAPDGTTWAWFSSRGC